MTTCTYQSWFRERSFFTISVAFLIALFVVDDAKSEKLTAQPAAPTESEKLVPSVVSLGPTYQVAAAGSRPSFDSYSCRQMNNIAFAKTQLAIDGDDMKVVENILRETSPNHGMVLFTLAPKEFMWWVRMGRSLSIISLGMAVHETNHAVDAVLTGCNGGDATYSLNGVSMRTEHRPGETPNYSMLAATLPPSMKGRNVGSRYPQYIEINGTQLGSDFSLLLDEFVAHVGAAGMELSIVRSKEYGWLLNREMDAYDGNSGGMADFMLYVLAYLKAVRINHPEAYARILKQANTLSLIQATWTEAESILTSIYDHTLTAKRGGVLVVSREAISLAYSDEFLPELDRLGIFHLPASTWSKTYLHSQ